MAGNAGAGGKGGSGGAGGAAGSAGGATAGAGGSGGAGAGGSGGAGAGGSGGRGGSAGAGGGGGRGGSAGSSVAGAGGSVAGAGGGSVAGAGGSSVAGAGGGSVAGAGGSSVAGAGGGSVAGAGGSATGGAAGGGTAGSGGVAGPLMFDVSTSADPVAPGGRLLYTISVGNISTHAVDGVAVSLLLPVGIQFSDSADTEPNSSVCAAHVCATNGQATWNLGSLAAGSTRTIEINALVLQTVGAGDSIAAAFKLTATGINDAIFTKTVSVYAQSSAQLSTGTATYPLTAGQTFTLDLDVGQIGMNALAGATLQASVASGLSVVSISDGGTQSASSGAITWSIGSLGVGAALHRQVVLAVDGGVPAGAILATRATLTYDGGVAVDAAAEYAVAIAAAAPALVFDVATAPNPAIPSGRLAYRMTVANIGTRAIDDVTVRTRVPVGLQFSDSADTYPNSSVCAGRVCAAGAEAFWSLGTLAAGASQTIDLDPLVVATSVGNGNLIRSAFVVSGTGVSPLVSVRTLQVYDNPGAQLALSATANPVTNAQAFTYALDVGQIGTGALTGAALHASLGPGLTIGAISDGGTQVSPGEIVWSVGTIGVGGGLRRTVNVVGNGTAVPGTILRARATLTYDGGAAVDAIVERAVSVVGTVQPVSLAVTASPNPATPGNRLLYSATVTNGSARAIDSVVLQLRVPSGLQFSDSGDADPDSSVCAGRVCAANAEAFWSLGSIAAGASQIITVNAQVLASLLHGSLIPMPLYLTATGLDAPVVLDLVVPAQ